MGSRNTDLLSPNPLELILKDPPLFRELQELTETSAAVVRAKGIAADVKARIDDRPFSQTCGGGKCYRKTSKAYVKYSSNTSARGPMRQENILSNRNEKTERILETYCDSCNPYSTAAKSSSAFEIAKYDDILRYCEIEQLTRAKGVSSGLALQLARSKGWKGPIGSVTSIEFFTTQNYRRSIRDVAPSDHKK